MVALKLVRLIEKHSEELVRGLAEHIRTSERMSDFRNIPPADLELAAAEVYCHLGRMVAAKDRERYGEADWGNRRTARGRAGQPPSVCLCLDRQP